MSIGAGTFTPVHGLDLNKDLALIGAEAAPGTTIRSLAASHTVLVAPGTAASLTRLTVMGPGDGVVADGSATISASTIARNGGDGLVARQGEVSVSDSTITNNLKAGIRASRGTIRVDSSTITDNRAGVIGARSSTVTNSIVAGNAGGDCINTSGSSNLSDDGTCIGQQVTLEELALGPLADNGGPTWTRAPGSTSAAVDASREGCTSEDQRGVSRPQGAACDVGAVELASTVAQLSISPQSGLRAGRESATGTYGDTYTLTVTVRPAVDEPALPTPRGIVEFTDNGQPLVGCRAAILGRTGTATCTVNLAAGDHAIRARFDSTNGYHAATSNAQGVHVAQATLTITASDEASTYGATLPTPTASYSGFVNGDSPKSLTTEPTCKTNIPGGPDATTGTTRCTGAVDPNYAFDYVDGRYTENPAPLTVTASDVTITYGQDAAPPVPSYQGLVNGDSPSDLNSQPHCSIVTASSDAMSGTTECNGARDPHYDIRYVDGTYTENPAKLTIKASDVTIFLGEPSPTPTPIYDGFVNGDDESDVATPPTCSIQLNYSGWPAYTVCSGAVVPHYSPTYRRGTVTWCVHAPGDRRTCWPSHHRD